jgi:TM2 domain-containing membrane protein YozV
MNVADEIQKLQQLRQTGAITEEEFAVAKARLINGPPPVSQAAAAPVDAAIRQASGNKLAAGLCGIFLGSLGIHKFVLGLTTPGIIMLLVTLLASPFTCGLGALPMGIIGLIEGILYLTKSDEEFYETYIVGKKAWF